MLVGCAVLTDLSGLSEGEPSGGVEGGTEAATDAPSEAGDGGAPADASGCARYTDASFCVDFEGPSPIAEGTWSELGDVDRQQPKRTITLTQQDPISPPNAVVFDLAGGGSDCEYVRLIKRFTGDWATMTTRFEQRAENEGIFLTQEFRVSAKLSFSLLVALGGDRLVRLFVQKNENFVVTEVAGVDVLAETRVVGRWASIAIEYRALPTRSANLVIDGVVKSSVALPPELVGRDPEVAIGPHCAGGPSRVTVDDVAVFLGR